MRNLFSWFARLLAPRWGVAVLCLLLFVASSMAINLGLGLFLPVLDFFGEGRSAGPFHRIFMALAHRLHLEPGLGEVVGFMALVLSLGYSVQFAALAAGQFLSAGCLRDLRVLLHEKLLRRPYPAFLELHAAAAVSLLGEEARKVAASLEALFKATAGGLLALGGLAAMLAISVPFTVVVLAAGMGVSGLSLFLVRHARRRAESFMAAERDHAHFTAESVSGILVLQSMGLEAWRVRRARHAVEPTVTHWLRAGLAQHLLPYFIHLTTTACAVLGVIYGLSLKLSLAEVAVLLLIMSRISYQARSFNSAWLELVQTEPSALALQHLCEATPPQSGAIALNSARAPELEFRAVSFAYPRGDEVLRGASLVAQRDGFTAVVGSSGAGKSTLLLLAMGLLRPRQGQVLLDGRDIADYDRESLCRQIGFVGQDPFLFDDSVLANIVCDDKAPNMDKVRSAMAAAQFAPVLTTLPEGLNTRLGARGARLSGGERQRLSLARALYHDPPLLLLDEVSGSLDPATERGLQQALEQLAGRKTLLVAAHRPALLERAQRIYVLHQGAVVEVGRHDELMSLEGHYHRILHSSVCPVES